MKILYDWRGMPIEFIQQSQPAGSSSDTLFRLLMKYDGTGRRISKTVMHKVAGAADWDTAQVTHYTGIGTEIRENYAGPAKQTKVVVKSLQGECRKNKLACSYDRAAAADAGGVNMPVFFRVTLTRLKPRSYIEKDILRLSNGGAILPKQSFGASRQGLGRYGIEDAENPDMGSGVGYIPNTKFEWYLKNHLGSTMLVYGTQADANPAHADIGTQLAAYDYRAFGEMVELTPSPTGKVTENFTGKEHDDEIALDYFGARYLDPMLGMWISVDPKRQFSSPYLYAGNGYNPIGGVDPNGMFYEDGERCTEGMFVDATTNQGHVDPVVFDDLVLAHNEIMSVYDDILTAAAYSAGGYGGETRFWIDNGTTNGWGATPPKQDYVKTEGGRGFFFHVHLMRDDPNSPKQGLSPDDLDRAAEKHIATSALEVTTGRLFYFNAKPKYVPLVPRSLYPSGNIYDFKGYQIMTINPQSYKIPAPIILPKDTHYYK